MNVPVPKASEARTLDEIMEILNSDDALQRRAGEKLDWRARRALEGLMNGKSPDVIAKEVGLTTAGLKFVIGQISVSLDLRERRALESVQAFLSFRDAPEISSLTETFGYSAQEIKALSLAAQGFSDKAVAEDAGIDIRAAEHLLARIRKKEGVQSSLGLGQAWRRVLEGEATAAPADAAPVEGAPQTPGEKTDGLFDAVVRPGGASQGDDNPLSTREREVAALVAQGYKNKQMAEKMFISEQTVKNHLHNIFDKLGVSSRQELAIYVIRKGWDLQQEPAAPAGASVETEPSPGPAQG
jgi:DNA-binding NarL/FixJ family response regulator